MKIHLRSDLYPDLPKCLQFSRQWLQERWRTNPLSPKKLRTGRWGVTCKKCLRYL